MSNLSELEACKQGVSTKYNRVCDGCGKTIGRDVMVSVFRGKEGADVGVHLCKSCAGVIIQHQINRVGHTKVAARRVWCRVRVE